MSSLLRSLDDPAGDVIGRDERIVRSASESIILSFRFASLKIEHNLSKLNAATGRTRSSDEKLSLFWVVHGGSGKGPCFQAFGPDWALLLM